MKLRNEKEDGWGTWVTHWDDVRGNTVHVAPCYGRVHSDDECWCSPEVDDKRNLGKGLVFTHRDEN